MSSAIHQALNGIAPDMAEDINAKREAAIAAKKEERRQRREAIAADKRSRSARRVEEQKAKELEDAAQAEHTKQLEVRRNELLARREANREREGESICGYWRDDIVGLRAHFEECAAMHQTGEVVEGIAFYDHLKDMRTGAVNEIVHCFSPSAFERLARDESTFTFAALLELVCLPSVLPEDLERMLAWLEPQPPPPPKQSLGEEAQTSIETLFALYDQVKTGKGLTLDELTRGLAKSGVDPEALRTNFREFDADGNGVLDSAEFAAMMVAKDGYRS